MRATMKRKSMVALAMILALTITPPVALAASKGCIVQGFNEVNDPALSMYVGGDYRFGTVFNDFAESEGMTVVNGSVTGSPNAGPNGELNGGGKSNRLIAGRVAWGMGYIPAANGTHLAVGGDINLTNGKTVLTSGSITIGGRMVNGKAGIANSKNMPYGSNTVWAKWWAYGNHPTVYSQLGRNRALQVDLAGDGTITDFNNYVNTTLKPLSARLAALPATGSVSFSKAPDEQRHAAQVHPNDGILHGVAYVDISREGLLTFTGDGTQHMQVFNLDMNMLESKKTQLQIQQWSLKFVNIPEGQPIVVNVSGRSSYTWNTGWRIWNNSTDMTATIYRWDDALSRYRSITSRIMWNYPTATSLTLDRAHGIVADGTTNSKIGEDSYHQTAGSEALLPGSILLPNGDLYHNVDTNGRVLVGGNLIMDSQEHHNAPWIGFDQPQCFSVDGKTTAMLQ